MFRLCLALQLKCYRILELPFQIDSVHIIPSTSHTTHNQFYQLLYVHIISWIREFMASRNINFYRQTMCRSIQFQFAIQFAGELWISLMAIFIHLNGSSSFTHKPIKNNLFQHVYQCNLNNWGTIETSAVINSHAKVECHVNYGLLFPFYRYADTICDESSFFELPLIMNPTKASTQLRQ